MSDHLKMWQRAGLLLLVTVTIAFIVSTYFTYGHYLKLIKTSEKKHESYILADELRQSSDDLTRMVRTFAATGDKRFESQYWEVLAIRNGQAPRPMNYDQVYWDFRAVDEPPPQTSFEEPVSLRQLMINQEFSRVELELLEQAQDKSDALVALEEVAMRATNNQLKAEDERYRLNGESNREMAIRILHSPDYHRAKKAIMQPINKFLTRVDRRVAADEQRELSHLKITGGVNFLLVLLWGACGGGLVVLGRHIAKLETAALEESQDLLEEAQQIARLGSYTIRLTDGSIMWSDEMYRIFGYEPGEIELTLESHREMIHPDDRDELYRRIQSLRNGAQKAFCEYRILKKDGSERWVFAQGRLKKDDHSNPYMIIGTAQDVTERVEGEKAVIAAQKAEAANQAKSRFLANMSHEIRTPMNGVVGMLDVLSHSRLSTDDRKMVEMVRQSAFSLLGIIDDILDFSKIEAGKLELTIGEMRLEDEFDAVANLLDRVALEKNVELTMFFDPGIPRAAMGDALRLRQILTNLTGNALKFSSGQNRVGRVHLRAELDHREADRAWVRFSIEDNGIGIDQKEQERLFQAFEQAEQDTTRTYGGTGLGLAISQNLARMMGGKIEIESKVDAGSTFAMCLPFAISDDEAPALLESDLTDLEVVVVGDDPQFIEDYSRYLSFAGANVYTVDEMEEAWELIRERSLIEPICMLVMGAPGLKSAQEVVDRLLAKQPQKDVRLIVQLSYLSVELGKRRTVRPLAKNVYEIDREVLSRRHLLDAVAFSVGRVPVGTIEPEQIEFEALPVLQTREEAIAAGRLILVAEDNATNRDVIERQLSLLGFTADLSRDGVEALEKWQSGKYGLLLTDLNMPKMDGYELTTVIRRKEREFRKGRIPIVALTANALKGEEERCLEIGMDSYISKPVELDRLQAILESWLPQLAKTVEPQPLDAAEVKIMGNDESETGGDKMPEVVDPTMLGRMVGDDPDLQAELIGDFLATTEGLLGELEDLYAAHDADAYGALAHRLKSSVRSFGANKLGELFEALEQAGKSGDWETIDSRHEEVKPAFRAVWDYYKNRT